MKIKVSKGTEANLCLTATSKLQFFILNYDIIG